MVCRDAEGKLFEAPSVTPALTCDMPHLSLRATERLSCALFPHIPAHVD